MMKLSEDELLYKLNNIYSSFGYKRYHSECFEDYSLFLENKDFLLCQNVITFADKDGKLRAMRPDVTISLIKHLNVNGECEKVYYNEKVFRQDGEDGQFKEVSQAGVEIIGQINYLCQAEIAYLMLKTLSSVSDEYVLCVSNMAFTDGLFDWYNVSYDTRATLYRLLKSKNMHDFERLSAEVGLNVEFINVFAKICRGVSHVAELSEFIKNEKMQKAVDELSMLLSVTEKLGYKEKIRVDFSVVSDENYYNGLIFNGFINKVPKMVLSGGRYDKLCKKLDKNCGAIGFCLYLSELEKFFTDDKSIKYVEIIDTDIASALMKAQEIVDSGEKVTLRSLNND